jgi:hypothetical protein
VEAQVQLEGSRGSRESAERQVSQMLAMAAKQRGSDDPADAGVLDVPSPSPYPPLTLPSPSPYPGRPLSPSVRAGVDEHLSA